MTMNFLKMLRAYLPIKPSLPSQYSIHPYYPLTKDSLPSYGNEHIKTLTEFYGKEAEVEYARMTYTSSSLLDGDTLFSEWKIFRCALLLEKKGIMEGKKSVSPSLQDILDQMETFLGVWREFLLHIEATEHHDGTSCQHNIC